MADMISEIIQRVSELLGLGLDESYCMMKQAFSSSNPAEELLSILGCENIELVHEILENSELFKFNESEAEEVDYIEHIIPECGVIKGGVELVPNSAVGSHSVCFPYKYFNIVQSKVFHAVYKSNENVVIAAPTGCGKTDIALLAILQALSDGDGKVIYVVPMKALATEIYRKYREALGRLKYIVVEYTGDTEIGAKEADEADVIVSTPEKFDVATRRLSCVIKNIKLVVLDEIHLLGEERGPVIETIVARMYRLSELKQQLIRLIGLSATLPNYRDVGMFLKAKHVYYFDKMYRPVPLKITVTGFKKKSKKQAEENYLIKKLEEFLGKSKQVLVFVHSRNKTVQCAKSIVKMLGFDSGGELDSGGIEEDNSDIIGGINDRIGSMEINGSKGNNSAKKELSKNRTGKIKTKKRKWTGFCGEIDQLVRNKVGVHHAGMDRKDRLNMEKMFKGGEIKILVCTATLAWGVNLPAHCVIIKGTEVYDRKKGGVSNLGILDVIQIFGRAGRPQYDERGEAILITKASMVENYVGQLNESKGIESKLLHYFTDALNSEIYLRNVSSVASALKWIKNTFMNICMLKNPSGYGIGGEYDKTSNDKNVKGIYFDETEYDKMVGDYVVIAIKRLKAACLVRIIGGDDDDRNTWVFEPTGFGRIANLYYLSHFTMHQWIANIGRDDISVFLESEEFKQIIVREDEKEALDILHNRLVLEGVFNCENEGTVEDKLQILLHAHFQYINPRKYSLRCDQEYMLEQLTRMIGAKLEMYELLRDYDGMKRLLELERKVGRTTRREKLSCEIKLKRCGEFIYIEVVGEEEKRIKGGGRCVCFIYSEEKIIHAFLYNKSCKRYFQSKNKQVYVEIEQGERLISGTYECAYESGEKEFIKHGINVCGSTGMFIKISPKKFNLKRVKLVGLDRMNYFENQELINYKIYKSTENALVVCPDNGEETCYSLNTMLALEKNLTEEFIFLNKKVSSAPRKKIQRKATCNFNKAHLFIQSYETVIFKGCSYKTSYYPIYDLFKLCNNKHVLIYETYDFVQYLDYLINK